MYKVLVFAGTTEGYEICRFLADHKIETKGFVVDPAVESKANGLGYPFMSSYAFGFSVSL